MNINQLFFESRVNLFKAIVTNGHHAGSAARVANISYACTSKLVRMFEAQGLITRHKNCGNKDIALDITPFGLEVWKNLNVIRKMFENDN